MSLVLENVNFRAEVRKVLKDFDEGVGVTKIGQTLGFYEGYSINLVVEPLNGKALDQPEPSRDYEGELEASEVRYQDFQSKIDDMELALINVRARNVYLETMLEKLIK